MQHLRAVANLLLVALRAVPFVLWWLLSWPVRVIAWLRDFRVDLWIVEGEERHSRLPLTILCGLSGESKTYVLDLIFGDAYRERRLGRFRLWNLAKAIAKAGDCSLLVLDCDCSHLRFARPDDWFLVPAWLLGAVDLPYDEHVHSRLRTKMRSIIRRNDYQFEVTRDPEQFEDFYHNMYLPYIKQTYGKCARVAPHQFLADIFRQSELLLLKKDGNSIGGYVLMHGKAGPYLWESGIRDGNRQYVEDGAGSALYHFSLQYLHEQGHKKAFLGWSRAFLRNGVLVFKKRLSQRIVGANDNGFALKILADTPAAKSFLCNNPFLFKRRGELLGAVFVDGQQTLSAEEIEQIEKEYFHPGMSRVMIYRLPGGPAATKDAAAPELGGRVELCTIAEGRGG
jgi:hypothetical protein